MNNLKDLFVFSITNMLERFGFYALMSILIMSFFEQRGLSMKASGYYYSIFYSAIYVSMLIMGLVGDFANRRKVILGGMIAMTIGYVLYSIMSKENETSVIISGIFLVLGLGAFKPNLQVQVGDLYKNNFKNGALGYIIFYSFLNLGAIFAPLAAATIKDLYGINSVFLLSASATLLALTLYYIGTNSTKMENEPTESDKVNTNITYIRESEHRNENLYNENYGIDKLIGLIFLIIIVPFFWMAFNQRGLIYTFYLRDFVDLNGYSTEIFQTMNPIMVVLFSIIGVVLMYFFVNIKRVYSIFPFIGIGMIIVAIGYFIPSYGLANLSGKLPYTYAVLPVIIMTLGELFISPFLTLGYYHFSPAKVRGLFMALFMSITAVGNMLLFRYSIDYDKYGAQYTFNKIVIHILICSSAVFIVWFIIKQISVSEKKTNL